MNDRLENAAAALDEYRMAHTPPALLAVPDDQADAWPEPREIKTELPLAPEFDARVLLPQTLAEFVLDEADRMPCAPDYIAAALIVSLGSVIGARCAIKPKRRDDWIVTPNLFGGIVGDRAFYLEGWNGTGSFNIDRIARGSLHIKNLCLSVFGGIQPDLLERYLATMATSLDNDGRIQRFQVLV